MNAPKIGDLVHVYEPMNQQCLAATACRVGPPVVGAEGPRVDVAIYGQTGLRMALRFEAQPKPVTGDHIADPGEWQKRRTESWHLPEACPWGR